MGNSVFSLFKAVQQINNEGGSWIINAKHQETLVTGKEEDG